MRAHRHALLVPVFFMAATACQERSPLDGRDPVAVEPIESVADAYSIATIAMPAGTVSPGVSVPGSIGGQSVTFIATVPDTLVFVVPNLGAGTHEGVIELGPDRVGTFTLTVVPAEDLESADVDVVIDSAFALLDGAYARLNAHVAADTAGRRTRTAANLDLVAEYIASARAALATASPADRRAVARVLLANEAEIHYMLGARVSDYAIATFLATAAEPEECTDAGIKRFAAGLIQWNVHLKTMTAGGVAIGLLAAAAGATAAPAVVAIGTGALIIGLVSNADDVAINGNCAFVAIELLKKEVGGLQTSDMFTLSTHTAATPFVLVDGRETPIEIEARFRTPTTADTLFANGVAGLAGIWQDIESMLPFGSLAGEPPALPAPADAREEVRDVTPAMLDLESVSDPALTCYGDNDFVQAFLITCVTSDSLAVERPFTFTLRHTAGTDTLRAVFDALLAPSRGEGDASLSTLSYDSNGQFTTPLTMTMTGESYFYTRDYHDGLGNVLCEIVLTVAEASGTRAARMSTMGARDVGSHPLVNLFETSGPYSNWALSADFPMPEIAIAEYYGDWHSIDGTVTITRASEMEIVGTISANMGRYEYGPNVIRTGEFTAGFRAVNRGGTCPALGNG